MTSVAHNGFGCPYCRSKMAEEQEQEEESEYGSEFEEENEEEEYHDYALRGLRFFTNNLNGEEHDEEDIQDEENENQEDEEDDDRAVVPKLAPYLITQKLMEQGVNMEQLVKVLLLDHNEYEREDEEFSRISDELFGKLRIIISNHRPHLDMRTPIGIPSSII
jgi:hypothetical protein